MSHDPAIGEPKNSPAAVLPYADPSMVPGLSVVQEGTRICVVVPPAIAWWSFNGTLLCWLVPLAFLIGFEALVNASGFSVTETFAALAMAWPFTFAFVVLWLRWLDRVRRKAIFEFTPGRVQLRFEGSILPLYWGERSWPIAKVREIRFSSIGGKLIVSLVGLGLVSLYLGPDATRSQFIGDQLSAALAATRSLAASDEGEAHAVQSRPTPVQRRRRRRLRMAMIYVAAAMVASGFLLMFCKNPICAVAAWLLILASGIIAGITVGTQPREFWA